MKLILEDNQTGSGSLDAVRVVEFAAQVSQLWMQKKPYLHTQYHTEAVSRALKKASKVYKLQLDNTELIGELKVILTKDQQCRFDAPLADQLRCALERQIRILLQLIQPNADMHPFKPQLELMLDDVKSADPPQSAKAMLSILNATLDKLARIHAVMGLVKDTALTERFNKYVESIKSRMTKADQISASSYRFNKRKDRALDDVFRLVLKFILQHHHWLSKTISQ